MPRRKKMDEEQQFLQKRAQNPENDEENLTLDELKAKFSYMVYNALYKVLSGQKISEYDNIGLLVEKTLDYALESKYTKYATDMLKLLISLAPKPISTSKSFSNDTGNSVDEVQDFENMMNSK